ncbi:septal ring lytic transglycosylase RlpA family protein [Paraburkholderia sp. C35]|uniref:septal ring lytic transglycosylase RlpA family protein n=1 Tax=Paraburkholderia sp. C35 TaxID=2126993 RepID=UPI0031BAF130
MFTGCAQIPAEHQASTAVGSVSSIPLSTVATGKVMQQDDDVVVPSEVVAFQPVAGAPQTGHASWYAHKFQGRRTASGERFDSKALTAAHRTLPFGTYVRVTSLATSRSVVVRINDRGPFVKGRIIDLSYAAASELGLTRAPSMNVQIERVEKKTDTQTVSVGSES